MEISERRLVVQRAQLGVKGDPMSKHGPTPIQVPGLNMTVATQESMPTRVVCLINVVTVEELKDDEEHHIFYESDLAKWLEAVFVSLQKNPDNELNSYAENLIEKIISNQEENGYLNSFFTFFEPENKFISATLKVLSVILNSSC